MQICDACKCERAENGDKTWNLCRATDALSCAINARDKWKESSSRNMAELTEYRSALLNIESLLGACNRTDPSLRFVRDAVAKALDGVERWQVRRQAPPSIAEPYGYTTLDNHAQ